jgi:hypothetical protein
VMGWEVGWVGAWVALLLAEAAALGLGPWGVLLLVLEVAKLGLGELRDAKGRAGAGCGRVAAAAAGEQTNNVVC